MTMLVVEGIHAADLSSFRGSPADGYNRLYSWPVVFKTLQDCSGNPSAFARANLLGGTEPSLSRMRLGA